MRTGWLLVFLVFAPAGLVLPGCVVAPACVDGSYDDDGNCVANTDDDDSGSDDDDDGASDDDDGASNDDDVADDDDAAPDCPPAAVCWDEPGVFHAPTKGDGRQERVYDAPLGTWSRLRLEVDVYVGAWAPDPAPEPERHLLFVLVKNARYRDLFGKVMFRRADLMIWRHGWDLGAADKARVTAPVDLLLEETYHLVYDHDTGAQSASLVITLGPAVVVDVEDTLLNIDEIVFVDGDTIDVRFGFSGEENENEPASFGWEYRDLHLELIP